MHLLNSQPIALALYLQDALSHVFQKVSQFALAL